MWCNFDFIVYFVGIPCSTKRNTKKRKFSTVPNWVTELNQVCTKLFAEKKLSNLPNNLTCNRIPVNYEFEEDDFGDKFPFLNREEECVEFANLICNMEKVRLRALQNCGEGWEKYKRNVKIGLIMGLSGLGKTAFARRAIYEVDVSKLHVDDRNFIASFRTEESLLNIRVGMYIYL